MSRPAAPSPFTLRHARWAELLARQGPARAYPYAWRLPKLARGEGPQAMARAALALGRTLYGLGRFPEALHNLARAPEVGDAGLTAAIDDLRRRCLWLTGEAVQPPPAGAGNWLQRAYFHYLSDRPLPPAEAACTIERTGGAGQAWSALLTHWSRLRAGLPSPAAPPHAALAGLRRQAPAEAAEAAAVYAEAAFHAAPGWSLVWLEEALAEGERYGQHLLKARLLYRKACALEAAGALREAARFLALARELAARQGAWRWQREMR